MNSSADKWETLQKLVAEVLVLKDGMQIFPAENTHRLPIMDIKLVASKRADQSNPFPLLHISHLNPNTSLVFAFPLNELFSANKKLVKEGTISFEFRRQLEVKDL
jgi:hypothetical protein